jgi:DNA-binding MarR family transcriptional regulator
MFKLRALPTDEALDKLVVRYPGMNRDALKAGLTLLRLGHDMTDALDAFLARFDLNQGTFFCLTVMNRDPDAPCSANQLADALGVSSATMTSLLSRLESLGYIQRNIDPNDRRKLCVSLSPAGRRFLDGFLPDCYANLSGFMDAVGKGELSQLSSILERLSGATDLLRGPAL